MEATKGTWTVCVVIRIQLAIRLRTVQPTNTVEGYGCGMCLKVIHAKLGLLSIKVCSC